MDDEHRSTQGFGGTLDQAKRIRETLAEAHGIAESLRDIINEIDPQGVAHQMGLARDRANEMRRAIEESGLEEL